MNQSEKEFPIKITGEINLGRIDFEKERELAIAELRELREEHEAAMRALGEANQELRDQIHHKEIAVLQLSFQSQIEALAKMIETHASKSSFAEQLSTFKKMAKELGYSRDSAKITK